MGCGTVLAWMHGVKTTSPFRYCWLNFTWKLSFKQVLDPLSFKELSLNIQCNKKLYRLIYFYTLNSIVMSFFVFSISWNLKNYYYQTRIFLIYSSIVCTYKLLIWSSCTWKLLRKKSICVFICLNANKKNNHSIFNSYNCIKYKKKILM